MFITLDIISSQHFLPFNIMSNSAFIIFNIISSQRFLTFGITSYLAFIIFNIISSQHFFTFRRFVLFGVYYLRSYVFSSLFIWHLSILFFRWFLPFNVFLVDLLSHLTFGPSTVVFFLLQHFVAESDSAMHLYIISQYYTCFCSFLEPPIYP